MHPGPCARKSCAGRRRRDCPGGRRADRRETGSGCWCTGGCRSLAAASRRALFPASTIFRARTPAYKKDPADRGCWDNRRIATRTRLASAGGQSFLCSISPYRCGLRTGCNRPDPVRCFGEGQRDLHKILERSILEPPFIHYGPNRSWNPIHDDSIFWSILLFKA